MVRPLCRPATGTRGAEEVAVVGNREPAELEPEDVGEDQPDPDRMGGDPDQDEGHRRTV